MDIDDKDRFLDVMKGVPSSFLTQALNTYGTGSNWIGCSKKLIHGFLFDNSPHNKQTLNKIPSVYELRDHAIRIQENSRKAMVTLKNMKQERWKRQAEEDLLKISMKQQQKETVLHWINKGYKIDGVQVRLKNDENIVIYVSDISDISDIETKQEKT